MVALNAAPNLQEFDRIPPGFLDAQPRDLAGHLGGPALISLPGRRTPALFVSVLQHGNEITGVQALQTVLRRYAGRVLPRALRLFVANVTAATEGVRRLDGQPDYNRVWPGGADGESAEARLMASVTARMRAEGCFASIDLHNNSGHNPHYACVNRLDPRYLALAGLFSRTIVHFTRPTGVQSLAFAPFCPAVTVECGQPGSTGAVAHAAEFVDAVLNLAAIPDHVVPRDLGVFHTVAIARVADDCGLGSEPPCLTLAEDVDRLNFRELPAGTELAVVRDHPRPVIVEDEAGEDVTERYLGVRANRLITRRRLMPAMLTRDLRILRQDCFGYFMERLDPVAMLAGAPPGVPR